MLNCKFYLFFIALLSSLQIFSEDLEVRLSTRSQLPSLYLGPIQGDTSDWRYLEELRNVLQFDLSTAGVCSLLEQLPDCNEALTKTIQFAFWTKRHIPFLVTLQASNDSFQITVFQTEKGTFKKYPPFQLKDNLDLDRREIHKLADMIQRDLFHVKGIASLRLIYTRRTKNPGNGSSEWLSEIWMCDSDGANARQILGGQPYCLTPAFFPKKQEDADFYFVSHDGGQSKIYKASLDHPTPKPMIDLRGNQLLPNLSKKGTLMAFISDVAGRPDLFIQQFDLRGQMLGKARQLFSAPRATQASPTFNPEGTQVAFVSDKDGPPRIYILPVASPKNTQKLNPKLITKRNRENTSPSWSPDGKKIAYSAKVDGVRQIWIYDIEKDEEMQLTTGAENKESPSWAPNSLHLVYNTESEESSELYQINLEQKTPVLLTKGYGQKRFASWEQASGTFSQ